MRAGAAAACLVALLAIVQCVNADVFPPRKGLYVGTRENLFDGSTQGKDVVYSGNQTSWTAGDIFLVSNIVDYFDLYLSLEPVANMSSRQLVTVTTDTDDTFTAEVHVGQRKLSEEGGDVNVTVGHAGEVRLHVQIDCTNTTGLGEGEVGISIANYSSHVLLFHYNCTNALDYAYGFGVATAPSDPDGTHLIENGRVINDYSLFVGPDQDSVKLYTFLDTLAPIGDTYQYNIVTDTFEELLDVTVTPESGKAGNGPRTPFTLNFECDKEYYGDSRNGSVTVTFIFPEKPGSKTTEDASFNLVKECRYLPHAPDTSGGWSAFGIFAFTVFMITFVFCVAGCIVNRFHFHKQGADIVPCMPLCRRIVGGGNKGVYTPQAELEDNGDASGSRSAYGSYEENL